MKIYLIIFIFFLFELISTASLSSSNESFLPYGNSDNKNNILQQQITYKNDIDLKIINISIGSFDIHSGIYIDGEGIIHGQSELRILIKGVLYHNVTIIQSKNGIRGTFDKVILESMLYRTNSNSDNIKPPYSIDYLDDRIILYPVYNGEIVNLLIVVLVSITGGFGIVYAVFYAIYYFIKNNLTQNKLLLNSAASNNHRHHHHHRDNYYHSNNMNNGINSNYGKTSAPTSPSLTSSPLSKEQIEEKKKTINIDQYISNNFKKNSNENLKYYSSEAGSALM